MVQKKMELDIVNAHCAGIDIGSKSHFAAVGKGLEDLKEFGDQKRKLKLVARLKKSITKFE